MRSSATEGGRRGPRRVGAVRARASTCPRAGEVVHAQRPVRGAGRGRRRRGGAARAPGGRRRRWSRASATTSTARARARAWPSSAWRCARRSRERPTRRAVTLLDERGRAHDHDARRAPGPARRAGAGALARAGADSTAIYFTAGGRGGAARWRARRARVLVASPRAAHALGHGVELDALVLSGRRRARAARAPAGAQSEARAGRVDRRRARRAATGDAPGETRQVGRRCAPPGGRWSTPTAAGTRSPRGSRSALGARPGARPRARARRRAAGRCARPGAGPTSGS